MDVPFERKLQENEEIDEVTDLLGNLTVDGTNVVEPEDEAEAEVLSRLMEEDAEINERSERKEEKRTEETGTFNTVNDVSKQEEINVEQVESMLKNIVSGKKSDITDLDEVQQKVLKCLGLIA